MNDSSPFKSTIYSRRSALLRGILGALRTSELLLTERVLSVLTRQQRDGASVSRLSRFNSSVRAGVIPQAMIAPLLINLILIVNGHLKIGTFGH